MKGFDMAFVIYSEEEGVFIGECLGLGFWSKLDPVDQDCAVTFSSVDAAEAFMAGWEGGRPVGATLVPVVPDRVDGSASIAACMRAGLPEWITDNSETANYRPI
ncbi:hypothetical protein [Massilia orientalis]|uniref:Uncharacterized protein n=1 Tax=Massilia orientalis TaxID=3050128 RepID=A0ACC7MG67_9BURK|nr:hypothetical protein [Massilia sp. YIM B02787]